MAEAARVLRPGGARLPPSRSAHCLGRRTGGRSWAAREHFDGPFAEGACPPSPNVPPKLCFEFVPVTKQSTLGGLPALEVLAQQFDLWNKVRALPGLDPRTRTGHGYSPALIVAQALYCFCAGGASLADAGRLNDEPLVRQLARVEKFAAQTQFGEWLRQQNRLVAGVGNALVAAGGGGAG